MLYRVLVGSSGKTVSLRKFCEKAGISYQSCLERVRKIPDEYDAIQFDAIVQDMLKRRNKRRYPAGGLHNCPHCRCNRTRRLGDYHAPKAPTDGQDGGLPASVEIADTPVSAV